MSDDLNEPTGLIALLIAAIVGLVGAIVYLYRQGGKMQRRVDTERKLLLEDRASWEAQREKLRADCEAKLREAVEGYSERISELNAQYVQSLHIERRENRESEARIRGEFAELIERISVETGKHSDAIRAVLQKFLDRFVGPRSRG